MDSKEMIYLGIIAVLSVALFYTWVVHVPSLTSALLSSEESPQPPQQNNPPSQPTPSQPQTNDEGEIRLPSLSVESGDLPPLGDPDAPIKIIEFSDFQCPFCGRLFVQTLPLLKSNYVETNKAAFYYRDFPLTSIHPNALPAALAARCANEQNAFWDYHDMLFNKQGEWGGLSDPKEVFVSYAEELGLDKEQFSSCYDSQKYKDEIIADLNAGLEKGVRGTPSLFIVVPKANAKENFKSSVLSLSQQMGGRYITLFENENEYVVKIGGALPFEVLNEVLRETNL